jgi:hypothetical protein
MHLSTCFWTRTCIVLSENAFSGDRVLSDPGKSPPAVEIDLEPSKLPPITVRQATTLYHTYY